MKAKGLAELKNLYFKQVSPQIETLPRFPGTARGTVKLLRDLCQVPEDTMDEAGRLMRLILSVILRFWSHTNEKLQVLGSAILSSHRNWMELILEGDQVARSLQESDMPGDRACSQDWSRLKDRLTAIQDSPSDKKKIEKWFNLG